MNKHEEARRLVSASAADIVDTAMQDVGETFAGSISRTWFRIPGHAAKAYLFNLPAIKEIDPSALKYMDAIAENGGYIRQIHTIETFEHFLRPIIGPSQAKSATELRKALDAVREEERRKQAAGKL